MIEYLQRRIAAAQEFAKQGPEQARLVASNIFSLQNSLKVYVGRVEALRNKTILGEASRPRENDLRAKLAANPEWKRNMATHGTRSRAWRNWPGRNRGQQFFRRTDSQLFTLALEIVQYVAEIKKPDGERLPQYHEAGLGFPALPDAFSGADLSLHGEALHG